MKPIRTMVTFALACGLQLGMGSAWAQEDGLVTGSAGAVTYASGGVGDDQRAALAAMKPDFNLRLTFATRGSGDLKAGVALAITDSKRKPMMQLADSGPNVYVKLPAGTYWISATLDGQEQSRSVTLGRNGAARDVLFYWGEPADQATVR
ncbi:hypothetical protein IP91_01386 [Pseudoduganella lurida]|uniref:Carboxypeptidase regulatory-like domain-containing protein n=1 Tax=Pseudoduganella lurida TaxID=1036180 RepID=A0A562REC4_9BURK|nr:carboxypeptidase regulatory-like domain-containing protein [Pseudoduganella lurida]TWI67273.1 hypothetical protein IP91_01386 [Pseudoduganella lurida]